MGRDRAWNGTGNEKRPDGRYYLDTDFRKFCATYHHRGGCRDPCVDPRFLSHNCEFCRQPHRTTSCSQKPDGWTPPADSGPQKGKGKKGGKGKGWGKGGKSSGYRAW